MGLMTDLAPFEPSDLDAAIERIHHLECANTAAKEGRNG